MNNITPKFSILMCTYNSAATMIGALNSVLSQTYSNWELIILDNGSTDDTVSILKNIEEKDSRFRFIYRDSNIGWGHGTSECMKAASGDYIIFLAADDMLADAAVLARAAECIIENAPDIIFTGNYYGNFNSEDSSYEISRVSKPPISGMLDGANKLKQLSLIMESCYYNSMFHYIRLDFLRENGIDFFEPFFCDSEGVTEAICKAEKIYIIDEPLYTLTLNTSKTSTAVIARIMTKQWESVMRMLSDMPDIDVDSADNRDYLSYIASRILANIYNQIIGISNISTPVRNLDMNDIEITPKERLQLVYEFLNDSNVLEMQKLAGSVANQEIMRRAVEELCELVENE